MLEGFIGDLEKGDVFKPVQYVLRSEQAAEYAHGGEENAEWFHSDKCSGGRQMRLPTMIHNDKMRILEANCTKESRMNKSQYARDARVHYEYHARHHSAAYVGETLIVTGHVSDRFVKRGRVFLQYHLEVHTADGRLVTTYDDKTLLKYRANEDLANE